MLIVDKHGRITDHRIRLHIFRNIEHGPMRSVHGIIVHQTDSPTASATLASYAKPHAAGAHFLIDKDGTIYQTASIFRKTWHVGKLRARCVAEHRCRPGEIANLTKMKPTAINRHEAVKHVPDRYPSNSDSIGIEIVGEALPLTEPNPDKRVYEAVTAQQNASLKWLVAALAATFHVSMTEVFRHPVVAAKNATEARTARW